MGSPSAAGSAGPLALVAAEAWPHRPSQNNAVPRPSCWEAVSETSLCSWLVVGCCWLVVGCWLVGWLLVVGCGFCFVVVVVVVVVAAKDSFI